MSTPSVLIEQLVNDFECVTVAILTETLGMSYSSALQTLLEFVKGRNDLKLLYSVCYIDEDNDIVLSHKSEDELEGLNGRYMDVKSSLLGICKGKECVGVTQTCWRHELDIVEKGLQKSLENGSLYIPSYTTIQNTDLRVRNYERVKQGDSSLCAPTSKPQSGVPTPVPMLASVPNSGGKRSTAGITDFFQSGKRNSCDMQKQAKLDIFNRETGSNNETGNSGDVTVLPEPATDESSSMLEDIPDISDNVNRRTTHDIKPALPQESQCPYKLENTISNEEPAGQSNEEPEMPSLFDCDAPSDPMELDVVDCKDGPVTYVEKVSQSVCAWDERLQVTKENTYVDSGYFVVEETNEYVQVTASTKSEAHMPSKCNVRTVEPANNRKVLLKKHKSNLNQSTLM
ncbi:hypothetical protein X943_001478 [Babesia divergens]|uniref:Uncharacterized protein n=1 Tax=Babesia divergens TaxID=32595 RepID=A0AAD9LI63_BABDI|nr:hypothetical protein X943_001478 [Babesia divergens]